MLRTLHTKPVLARRLPVQDPQHRPAPRSAAMRNAASAGKSIRSASRLPNPQILPTPEVICFVCGFSTRDGTNCSINPKKIWDSRDKASRGFKGGIDRGTAQCMRAFERPRSADVRPRPWPRPSRMKTKNHLVTHTGKHLLTEDSVNPTLAGLRVAPRTRLCNTYTVPSVSPQL